MSKYYYNFDFEDLVESKAKFYGVNDLSFKLGSVIFTAVEDTSDGYRSSLDTIIIREENDIVFSEEPLALVIIKEINDGYFRGFQLVDSVTGEVWLRVGTDNADDYYPSFVFNDFDNRKKMLEIIPSETVVLEKIRKKLLD